jgi:hypothetical protein
MRRCPSRPAPWVYSIEVQKRGTSDTDCPRRECKTRPLVPWSLQFRGFIRRSKEINGHAFKIINPVSYPWRVTTVTVPFIKNAECSCS